jgi:hypothetical protein
MKAIEEFSKQITANLADENKDYSFDPSLIILIGSIIISVLQLLMKCNIFGRKLDERIKNPGPIDRILLRKAIKNKLTPEYVHLKDQIQDKILKEVQNLSKDKINLIAEEAKNARQT